MNREWILANLHEAREELNSILAAFESLETYEEAAFEIDIAHIYSHLNVAWNARNIDRERAAGHTTADYYEWCGFPTDISITP